MWMTADLEGPKIPLFPTENMYIFSLCLGCMSVGMAFPNSVCISLSAGSPRSNWLHLILVDSYLNEKQGKR